MRAPEATSTRKSRFVTLDYLRGWFIFIIIVDHLWRWPSLLQYTTGRGDLWVSAAEGFVIISGLLVGYVRGRKNITQPLHTVAKKLISRGLLLFVWSIVAAVMYTYATWQLADRSIGLPALEVTTNNWTELFVGIFTFQYAHPWVYFLHMYAIFLVIAPLFIYLFRKKLYVVSIGLVSLLYVAGLFLNEGWMQWTTLFFIPALVGFHIPTILDWWQKQRSIVQRSIALGFAVTTIITMVLSYIIVFSYPDSAANARLSVTFSRIELLSLPRIGLSFIWFVGVFFIFQFARPLIDKWLAWLLLPLSYRSLTAYILHGAILLLIAYYIPQVTGEGELLANTAIGVLAVGVTWLLVKLKIVQKILPQ